MIDDSIIIKMKKNVIERCKERIIDSQNKSIDSQNKPKNKDVNHEEYTFTSKLKKNRGL